MLKMDYGRFPLKTLIAVMLASMAAPGFAATAVVRKPVGLGAYEMVYSAANHSVLVATSQGKTDPGGVVYELDAKTLQVIHAFKTGKKPFGAAINSRTGMAWFGGSIEGCVIALDIQTGAVKGVVQLTPPPPHAEKRDHPTAGKAEKRNDKRPPAPRELAVDDNTNTVYVSGVGRDDSLLWVIDGNTLTLKQTLHGLGKLNTGLALDSANHRLYTSNADGDFITIDTTHNQVISRTRIVADSQEHLLMNISLDSTGQRAFVADNKVAGVFVIDTQNGKVINHIAVPETLSVLFNAQRNEIYAAHRNQGTVSIIDGTTYAVKNSVALPVHPNSLALSAEGNALYVSVKQDAGHDKPTTQPDDVVRIALN